MHIKESCYCVCVYEHTYSIEGVYIGIVHVDLNQWTPDRLLLELSAGADTGGGGYCPSSPCGKLCLYPSLSVRVPISL